MTHIDSGISAHHLCVCIPTHCRPEKLAFLLTDLLTQSRLPQQIVVVDNDGKGSAREVVLEFQAMASAIDVVYAIQPEKNISITRNRAIALAGDGWIAMVDDDERVPPHWLQSLLNAACEYSADGVLGPVDPVFPAGTANWLRRSGFFDSPHLASGTLVQLSTMRSGNVLLKTCQIKAMQLWFDPAFGLTGGEDGDFLSRMAQYGHRLVWSEEAAITEPVAPNRLALSWMIRRAWRGGQDYAIHFNNGRLGVVSNLHRAFFFSRALIQAIVAVVLAVVLLPTGAHQAVRWLVKSVGNLGKLSVLWGSRYREYA